MKTDLLDIRNCDCMDLMREYPDNHFELAIVDPPYGIGASRGTVANIKSKKWRHAEDSRDYKPKKWDSSIPKGDYFTELKRVSVNQIIWGGNYFIQYLEPTKGVIVWDKLNGDSMFGDGEFAWSSFNKKLRIFKYLMNGFQNQTGESRIHPTQKPIALYKWLLQNYAKEGDKILDTHMGSGSIAIACHYMRYNLTACELDPDYYQAACERIKRETAQLDIFQEAEPALTPAQQELI